MKLLVTHSNIVLWARNCSHITTHLVLLVLVPVEERSSKKPKASLFQIGMKLGVIVLQLNMH